MNLHDCFQEINFWKYCFSSEWELVVPHFVSWRGIYHLSRINPHVYIALPGILEDLKIYINSSETKALSHSWIESKPLKILPEVWGIMNEQLDYWTPIFFDQQPHFFKYAYMLPTSKGFYHFVKFLPTPKSYPYQVDRKSCRNLTQKPKIFTWHQANNLCAKQNASLPEFFNRENQDELVNVVKELFFLFPLESVYIGLMKGSNKQVLFAKCLVNYVFENLFSQ